MRHPALWIALAILVFFAVRWTRAGKERRSAAHLPVEEISVSPIAAIIPAAPVAPAAPGWDARTVPPAPTEQQAFRFVMTDGRPTLEAVEEIRGDFHRRRGGAAWQPGMLCCRLLDAGQRVLAEETVAAPDRTCIVLDPNVPDAAGQPVAAQLTPTGPVVFQVRLPKMEAATQMKIYRLTAAQPAALNAEPGLLLATIPLTK